MHFHWIVAPTRLPFIHEWSLPSGLNKLGCLRFVIMVFSDHPHSLFLGWTILYIEGSRVIISKYIENVFFLDIVFVSANSVYPDEIHYVAFYLGLQCLSKCAFTRH